MQSDPTIDRPFECAPGSLKILAPYSCPRNRSPRDELLPGVLDVGWVGVVQDQVANDHGEVTELRVALEHLRLHGLGRSTIQLFGERTPPRSGAVLQLLFESGLAAPVRTEAVHNLFDGLVRDPAGYHSHSDTHEGMIPHGADTRISRWS